MSFLLKPWLMLAVIFVVGAVTGSALTVGLASHFKHPRVAPDMKRNLMMNLTQQLHLTADQQAKLDPILTEAGTQFQSVHRDEVERILAILTPEQQAKLQEIEQNHGRMFPGHRGPWGSSHGGPGGMSPRGGPGGMMPSPDMSTNAAPAIRP